MQKLSSWERKHRANMSGYQRQIDALYNDVIKEASLLAASVPNFSSFHLLKKDNSNNNCKDSFNLLIKQ